MRSFRNNFGQTGEIRHILAIYDIHNPRRLIRVAKVMKDYGERVLKSVFECNLNEAQFLRMKERIDGTINPMEDSVRFYFVCGKCLKNVQFSGLGSAFVRDEEVIIA